MHPQQVSPSDCNEDLISDFILEGSTNTSQFDRLIGSIEDILIDINFNTIQREFMEKYWQEFDDGDENKLNYMTIFEEYIEIIEKYIENQLRQIVPEFGLDVFIQEVQLRKKDLYGEVFEMLYTLSDFVAFKDMMLDYKAEKEGRTIDFRQDLQVISINDSIVQ